jgi:hypothetical protein
VQAAFAQQEQRKTRIAGLLPEIVHIVADVTIRLARRA